ncbi:hypothetical protein LCGC14_0777750 [marine sediment metagenome]|uniref:Uncharacterized protein n=1 Tax=marine sediment metagenome TaxID=412755 RepID=A0A0F9SGB3_9ZZZZ
MTLSILTKPAAPAMELPAGLIRDDELGHYYKGRERHLYQNKTRSFWRHNALAWLRDHVSAAIPRLYYNLVLGHDLHISTYAELYVRHFHATERDPFTGKMGWMENVGLVSRGKVTVEFRDYEIDQLQTEDSTYGDFKFHRPGTSAQAESSADTGLIADAGLEATGTQIEGATADIYKSVATVTADATETWQEHSIANLTGVGGGELMDRSLVTPTVSVVNLDTVEFTYELTKNEEA